MRFVRGGGCLLGWWVVFRWVVVGGRVVWCGVVGDRDAAAVHFADDLCGGLADGLGLCGCFGFDRGDAFDDLKGPAADGGSPDLVDGMEVGQQLAELG